MKRFIRDFKAGLRGSQFPALLCSVRLANGGRFNKTRVESLVAATAVKNGYCSVCLPDLSGKQRYYLAYSHMRANNSFANNVCKASRKRADAILQDYVFSCGKRIRKLLKSILGEGV